MSGVLRRTMFVHNDNTKILFHDWCRVTTGIGDMVEPRCVIALRGTDGVTATGSAVNASDDICRIDALETLDIHLEKIKLSDEEHLALHGGQLWQRVGF